MATQSPFSFLDGLLQRVLAGPQPPAWLVRELQHRLVLFLNHVLMQEREAMERLTRQRGRVAAQNRPIAQLIGCAARNDEAADTAA